MPKATRTHTTPAPSPDQEPIAVNELKRQALRQRYTIAEPATGDALLIALAQAFRKADDAGAAFEDAALTEDGIMKTYLTGATESHYRRRDVIEQALCCIPASDLAGAMIQVEAIARLAFRGPEHDLSQAEELRDLACRSIFRVLAQATGRTSADGLALELAEAKDDFATDVDAYRAGLKAHFEANGLADLTAAPGRARSAGAAGRAGA